MKVYLGPYKRWWGPYQIADLLQYVGVSDARCHSIGGWLADTWVNEVCEYIHRKRGDRKTKIVIDNYDIWNAFDTMAQVILPILKAMKNGKHGAPYVDNIDVPIELRTGKPGKMETDENWFKRWDYILDEMIWTFEHIIDEDWEFEIDFTKDRAKYDEMQNRIANGLMLFGKYFRGMWT